MANFLAGTAGDRYNSVGLETAARQRYPGVRHGIRVHAMPFICQRTFSLLSLTQKSRVLTFV